MKQGWIKLHRKALDNFLYKEDRPATRREAWEDILLLVSHAETEVLLGNRKVTVFPGQSVKSLKSWAFQFRWSKSKVKRFFALLETEGMIKTESVGKSTRLTVCEWENYQADRNTTGLEKEQISNGSETMAEHKWPTDNNVKNAKNDKKIPFEQFWDLYGKKVGAKPKCKEKWNRLPLETQQLIMEKLPAWKAQHKDAQFQPYPHTFLNQGYYESEDFKNAGEPQINGQSETAGVKMETI